MSQKIPNNYAWNLSPSYVLQPYESTLRNCAIRPPFEIIGRNQNPEELCAKRSSSRLGLRSDRQHFQIILPEIHSKQHDRGNKRNGVSQWDNWILRISEENSISPPPWNRRFNGKIFTSRSGLIRREDGPIIIQRLIMILSLSRLRCVGRETANYTRFGPLLASWVSFYRIQSEDRSSCQPTKQSQEQTVDISPRRFTSLKTKPRTLRARCVPRWIT